MKKEPKNREPGTGRFAKGSSGNPAGRPPGSRNRATLQLEELLADDAAQLLQKIIALAKQGNLKALQMCMDRILPARQDRLIQLTLPPIENAQQIPVAISAVLEAVATGEITPGEGEILTNILAAKTQVLEGGDHERRIAQLEQASATGNHAGADQNASEVAERLREGRSPQEGDG